MYVLLVTSLLSQYICSRIQDEWYLLGPLVMSAIVFCFNAFYWYLSPHLWTSGSSGHQCCHDVLCFARSTSHSINTWRYKYFITSFFYELNWVIWSFFSLTTFSNKKAITLGGIFGTHSSQYWDGKSVLSVEKERIIFYLSCKSKWLTWRWRVTFATDEYNTNNIYIIIQMYLSGLSVLHQIAV